jgi:hypothetical protein
MSSDPTPKVKSPLPLTIFDNLKDAALSFTFEEKENAVVILSVKENARPVKYTITKPTVDKLHRWLRLAIVHM